MKRPVCIRAIIGLTLADVNPFPYVTVNSWLTNSIVALISSPFQPNKLDLISKGKNVEPNICKSSD